MEPAGNAIYFSLLERVQKEYGKFLEPVCRQSGLSRNQMDVLLFLYNNPSFDRAADIVSRRGIAKSHVSLAVAGLEEEGLLTRQTAPEDRRAARLVLTQRGREVAARAGLTQRSFYERLFRGISREELEIIASVTHRVWFNLEDLSQILKKEE